MKRIKAYLFDLDGTLADSENYYVGNTQKCFLEQGIHKTIEEIKDAIVGVDMDTTYKYVSEVLDVAYDVAKEIYDDYFIRHPLRYKDYLYPHSLEVIKTLKQRGYKLALCTVNERKCVDDFLSSGFEGLFDFIITYDDGVKMKPDPDVYLKAMEALNINANEAIVVEDSTNGIKAGKASGAYVVGVDEANLNMDLSEADKVIKNLKEIL